MQHLLYLPLLKTSFIHSLSSEILIISTIEWVEMQSRWRNKWLFCLSLTFLTQWTLQVPLPLLSVVWLGRWSRDVLPSGLLWQHSSLLVLSLLEQQCTLHLYSNSGFRRSHIPKYPPSSAHTPVCVWGPAPAPPLSPSTVPGHEWTPTSNAIPERAAQPDAKALLHVLLSGPGLSITQQDPHTVDTGQGLGSHLSWCMCSGSAVPSRPLLSWQHPISSALQRPTARGLFVPSPLSSPPQPDSKHPLWLYLSTPPLRRAADALQVQDHSRLPARD